MIWVILYNSGSDFFRGVGRYTNNTAYLLNHRTYREKQFISEIPILFRVGYPKTIDGDALSEWDDASGSPTWKCQS